jgi:hypothetical protein
MAVLRPASRRNAPLRDGTFDRAACPIRSRLIAPRPAARRLLRICAISPLLLVAACVS